MFTLKNLINNNYQYDDDIIKMYSNNGYYDINSFCNLNNCKQNDFKLLDGPPFISGSNPETANLHMGHCLISYLKSAFDIYYLMNEYNVDLTTSSDNHGLPTELLISKYLNLKTTSDIKEIGLKTFNSTGLKLINMFESNWYDIYDKLGRDYSKNHYRTSQVEYMDIIWNTFYKLYKKGYVYKGVKILPYSYKLQTPLSNFEANENYKEIKTKTYYISVKLDSVLYPNHYFIYWTTTLWTVPFNVAICLNPEAKYYSITVLDKSYIVEEHYVNKITKVINKHNNDQIITKFIGYGKSLVDIDYIPVIKTFDKSINPKIYKTYTDDYVDIQNKNGCGIVHLSPAFGEDDFRICLKNQIVDSKNIFDYSPINDNGEFKLFDSLPQLQGLNIHCIDSERIITENIKDSIISTETIKHNYPFSPRTEEPLIYKVCESYFIKVKENRERLIRENEKINWKPSHIKNGRFGNWLKNADDWCISRNRYFGTPINIWISDDNDILVIKNIKQLEKLTKTKFNNIHPEYVFNTVIKINNKEYKNVKLTFDCWFESGCSCLIEFNNKSQDLHKIQDNTIKTCSFTKQKNFKPYDLCIEGIDQCRGYFYTSLIISTLLYDMPPFFNCICTGLVLDENNKKLSKSSGNYQPPENYIIDHGSDILRLYLLGSVLGNGENLKFNINDLKTYKQKIIQLINGLRFLNDYTLKYYKTNIKFIDIYKPIECDILDHWILSQLDELIINVRHNFSTFEIKNSVKIIMEFIDKLTNYYIKFKRNDIKRNVQRVFNVLFYVFRNLILLMTPFSPMLCEYLYNLYVDEEHKKSIKYLTYPTTNEFQDIELNSEFDDFIILLQGLRNIRKSNNEFKNKFINRITIYSTLNINYLNQFKSILKEELKVLHINFDYMKAIDYSIKFNFKTIGQKHKEIAKDIKNYNFNITDKEYYFTRYRDYLPYKNIELTDEYIEEIKPVYNIPDINYYVFDIYCVHFNYTETKEVKERNIIQKLINDIQDLRKEKNIEVFNNINVIILDTKDNIEIYKKYKNYMIEYLIVNDIIFFIFNDYKISIERLED